jgi:hypothetical protein
MRNNIYIYNGKEEKTMNRIHQGPFVNRKKQRINFPTATTYTLINYIYIVLFCKSTIVTLVVYEQISYVTLELSRTRERRTYVQAVSFGYTRTHTKIHTSGVLDQCFFPAQQQVVPHNHEFSSYIYIFRKEEKVGTLYIFTMYYFLFRIGLLLLLYHIQTG